MPAFAEGLVRSPRPMPRPGAGGMAVKSAPEAGALIEAAGLGGVVGYAVADARTGQLLEGLAQKIIEQKLAGLRQKAAIR